MSASRASNRSNTSGTGLLHTALIISIASWLLYWHRTVKNIVPDAYLDEVFHAPQAQAYWAGSWQTWNSKITTPPGLYLYSYIFAMGYSVLYDLPTLSLNVLRLSNMALLIMLPGQVSDYWMKDESLSPLPHSDITHSSWNFAAFPLLFFFSALYYTDVLSTVLVLAAYTWYAQRNERTRRSQAGLSQRGLVGNILMIAFEVSAVLVRQTNIFWVAVFLGGLQAVRTLSFVKHPAPNTTEQEKPLPYDKSVYDPPVQGAGIEG